MAQLAQVPKGGTAGGRNSGEARVCGCRRCKRLIPVISQAKGQNAFIPNPGAGPLGLGEECFLLPGWGEAVCLSVFLLLVCK